MIAWREVSPEGPGAAAACARYVAGQLEEALAAQRLATLAVSGGHTPKLMFQSLALLPVDWSRVHLFWVDERSVPPDDAASNYKLAKENLIVPAHIPDGNIHRIAGEIDPKEAARKYTDDIRGFFQLAGDAMPEFDVVQCGMGPDGHTASLFPGSPLVDDRHGIAAAVFAPQFSQWRVTLLPGPLLAARQLLFLVTGEDKAETVRAVFQQASTAKKYPAEIASEHPKGALWFLDQAAARLLDS
jgi:6-phosphogluconolactonase